jgi:hypothetical protein
MFSGNFQPEDQVQETVIPSMIRLVFIGSVTLIGILF